MGQPHRIVRMATAQDLPYLHRLARHAVRQLLGGHHLTAAQVRAATAARIFEVVPALVSAGTYYAAEIDGLVVAGSGWCEGGWLQPGDGGPRWARQGLANPPRPADRDGRGHRRIPAVRSAVQTRERGTSAGAGLPARRGANGPCSPAASR